MAKLKFHRDFTIREKGKDKVLKAGVHEIKNKASVTRWLKRGCELVETKANDEAKKAADKKAKEEAEAKAKLEAEEKAKAEAEKNKSTK